MPNAMLLSILLLVQSDPSNLDSPANVSLEMTPPSREQVMAIPEELP